MHLFMHTTAKTREFYPYEMKYKVKNKGEEEIMTCAKRESSRHVANHSFSF